MRKPQEKRLKDANPSIQLPENFTEKVMDGVERAPRPRFGLLSSNWKPIMTGATVGAFVLVASAVAFNTNNNDQTLANNVGDDVNESFILNDDDDLDLEGVNLDGIDIGDDGSVAPSTDTSESVPANVTEATQEIAVELEGIESEARAFGDEADFDDSLLTGSSLSF